VRTSRLLRAAAWSVVAAGLAAPRLRRRLQLPAPAVIATAAAAPLALVVVVPRSRTRDVMVCFGQMLAYLAAYEMPNDDPAALERRVRIDYPVRVDRAIGLGVLPGVRLQRLASRPGSFRRYEKVLVWSHWIWFMVPHSVVMYTILRHRSRFPAAALRIYGVFDLGAIVYWALPTAPPWYAARHGRIEADATPAIRRMMIEYGEQFWRDRWGGLYDLFGGNPLAAMPSIHFATTVMAAHVLEEIGPGHAVVGWTYAAALGTALVYLGEHYAIDLLAGLAVTEAVHRQGPRLAPLLRCAGRVVQALEARARA
jgi:hypothetical protein